MKAVADRLGVGTPETVRKWIRQGQVDLGARRGRSTANRPAQVVAVAALL